ncbi:MAG: heterodisulfide reductase subunit A, partial [Candidatus Rokuibacteriota bacterium]
MGLVRAQKASPPRPYTEANERTVLVVGGGAAGISAASSAARSGFGVVLVEREGELGGYAARLHKQFPTRPPYEELEPTEIAAQIRELRSLTGVTILTGSAVEGISGEPGKFRAKIRSGTTSAEVTVGAVVLATGWRAAGPE